MAENSVIEWTHHTFNPWIGCTKVGPGCDNCYASDLAQVRLGVEWGPGKPRRHTAASTWKHPRAWNRKAQAAGIRYRVFCASLADVFDNEVPAEWRTELFQLIRETPHLDWLLVTKRIGNVAKMAQAAGGMPDNVWLGATIVNQLEADRDISKLLETNGPRYRFLSMEPLLGEVNIEPWLNPDKTCQGCDDGEGHGNRCSRTDIPLREQCPWNRAVQIVSDHGPYAQDGEPAAVTCEVRTLDWVIVGGESGPRARPMHPDWARSLRDQCAAACVPFLFKQWGEWAPQVGAVDGWTIPDNPEISRYEYRDWEGDHWGSPFSKGWQDEVDDDTVSRIGKKRAGRLLDGVQHDGYPEVRNG